MKDNFIIDMAFIILINITLLLVLLWLFDRWNNNTDAVIDNQF